MVDLVRVEPVALLPTQAGCAVFLGDGSKAIVFYIEPSIGASINAALSGQVPPRPLTHDLFLDLLKTFGAGVQRVLVAAQQSDFALAVIALLDMGLDPHRYPARQVIPDEQVQKAVGYAVLHDSVSRGQAPVARVLAVTHKGVFVIVFVIPTVSLHRRA